MDYQLVIEQIAPVRRDWHFYVWINEPAFCAECQQRGIQSDFGHPSWPFDVDTWEGIIQEAAIDAVHDIVGIDVAIGCNSSGKFLASMIPGPFKHPTVKCFEFQLLLETQREAPKD